MKVKKIIITSIIINILLICVVYNFVKKEYLNNEKIIVKAMTEGEYEDYITSLNKSHIDYANYIQESKTKIASAITDMGVSTSNDATPDTMSNNIKSIAREASSIIYDNSSSTLTSTNVQGAVDELNNSLEQLVSNSQKIECGINTVSFNNSTDSLGRTINFKKSYTKVPIVITSTGHTGVNISAGSITTNGFIAYGRTIRGNSLNESTVFSYIVIEAE